MSKEGDFEVELAAPLRTKLAKLKEFVDENELMGELDLSYAKQWLHELDKMRVSRLKANVTSKKGVETWKLCMTINHRKNFEGTGPAFEDALLTMLENLEIYAIAAEMN